MNSKAVPALHAIAATAQKTPDPSKEVEQRYAYGIHVIHNVSMAELRESAGDVKPGDTAQHSAVVDHTAQILTEQSEYELPECIVRSILKQLNDIADIGDAEHDMSAYYQSDNYQDGRYDYVIDAYAFVLYQHIADNKTNEYADHGTDRISSYSMSEDLNNRIHII